MTRYDVSGTIGGVRMTWVTLAGSCFHVELVRWRLRSRGEATSLPLLSVLPLHDEEHDDGDAVGDEFRRR